MHMTQGQGIRTYVGNKRESLAPYRPRGSSVRRFSPIRDCLLQFKQM